MAGKDENSKSSNHTVGMTGRTDATCLIAKTLNRLVAMGSSRPRTLAKLSATLQSCTAVIPYLNPLDALELANIQANKPPPRVEISLANPVVYVPLNSVDQNFWDVANRDFRAGKKYFTYPPEDIDETMHQAALQWLQSMAEGTAEFLLEEFHQRCRKEQGIDVGEVFESLQKMGFVQADRDGAVTYHLPSPSDVLALKDTMNEYVGHICRSGSPWQWSGQSKVVHQTALYHSEYGKWNCEYDSALSDSSSFRFGDSSFPLAIDVTDVHALCILSEMKSGDKPQHLSDLVRALKPACEFLYLIPPANVLLKYREQLRHRPVLKARMKPGAKRPRVGAHEFAIGVSTKRGRVISLTPEGLLGVSEASVQELMDASEAASAARWCINGQSRGFAAMLETHLAPMLQQPGAVLVQATDEQKSEIVDRVLDWVDRYRSDPSGETETDTKASSGVQTHSQPVPLKQLQRELIAKCTVKMVKLPASAVATLLEQQGFIRVDRDDPAQPVTYLIPELSRGTAPAWRVAAAKYWKTSVKMCYSGVLARYFPPEDTVKKTRSVRPRKQYGQRLPRKQEKFYQHKFIPYSFLGAFVAVIFGLLISRSGIV